MNAIIEWVYHPFTWWAAYIAITLSVGHVVTTLAAEEDGATRQ